MEVRAEVGPEGGGEEAGEELEKARQGLVVGYRFS
jgi:hypothetical protein